MSRRHADAVEVRRRDEVPEQFLWRNRLYQVREVLGHWVESGAWWTSASSSTLIEGTDAATGGDAPARDLTRAPTPASPLVPIPAPPRGAQRAWGEPAPDVGAAVGPMTLDDGEREFWRVEAGAGRSADPGVYDLCFNWTANRWQLVKVMD